MSNRTVAAVRGLLLAGAAVACAQPGWAQETEQVAAEANEAAEAADVEGTNEIVVTARRRNEILQDVPPCRTPLASPPSRAPVHRSSGRPP